MKNVEKLVRITHEAAKNVGKTKDGLDLTYYNALADAAKVSDEFGTCKILVNTGPYSENDASPTFHLTGTAIEADPEDMVDTTTIIKRIRHDAGDDTVELANILNGDGLPLFYNGIFRDTFMVRKSRVNKAEVQNQSMSAAAWLAKTDNKEFLKRIMSGDTQGIIDLWVKAGKPDPKT
jgi:hypothetical protein